MTKQPLSLVEHIRLRPGMYIGDLSIRGLKVMLGYIFEYILDNNAGKTDMTVELKTNNRIYIKAERINAGFFLNAVQAISTNGMFMGFGLHVVIALSSESKIEVSQKTVQLTLRSVNGVCEQIASISNNDSDFLEIEFKPDDSIFKETYVDYDILNLLVRKYAFINKNLKAITVDSRERIHQTNVFEYPKGVFHQLDLKIKEQNHGQPYFRMDLETQIGEYAYQICFACQDIWLGQTFIMSYANYDEMIFGGSLEKGVLDGIKLALQRLAEKRNVEFDLRKIRKHLTLFAVIKGKDLDFDGATKTRLGMPSVEKDIKDYMKTEILDYLLKNKTVEEELIKRYAKFEELVDFEEFIYYNGGDVFPKLAEEISQRKAFDEIEVVKLNSSKEYIEAFRDNLGYFYTVSGETERSFIDHLIIPHIVMKYHENRGDRFRILVNESDYFIKVFGKKAINLSQEIRNTFKKGDWNGLIKLATEQPTTLINGKM